MDKKIEIAVAGTVIVDRINEITAYPKSGELTQIVSVHKTLGGCVPNVAMDLKRICPTLSVRVFGRVGKDADGEYVRRTLTEAGVDVSGLQTDETACTSFTEVMSVIGGQRTFFSYAGANGAFGKEDLVFGDTLPHILHIGYFLLLQKIDNGEGLEILKAAKAKGVGTSIDLVSENSDRYALVKPCLPYTDYLVINELEAQRLSGVPLRAEDGALLEENLPVALKALKQMGVSTWVVIHCPEAGFGTDEKNAFYKVPSLKLPAGYIKGTVGAGDAFCAGILYAAAMGKDIGWALRFGACTAAASLRAVGASEGVGSAAEIEKLYDIYG